MPRPVKKTEIVDVMNRRNRFKLVKVVGDKLLSVIAGTGSYVDAPILQYEIGRVTEAPAFGCADEDTPAKKLIYTYECLDDAVEAAGKVGTSEARAKDTRAIVKAKPIGFMRENREIEGVTMCEAVLVGEEVWRCKPEPPKPVWKLVPSALLKVTIAGGYISLDHDGNRVAHIGTNGVIPVDRTYRVTTTSTSGIAHTFQVEHLEKP